VEKLTILQLDKEIPATLILLVASTTATLLSVMYSEDAITP
jgi:hypothetical protein